MAEFVRTEGAVLPVSGPLAVARNRERLAKVAASWAKAFPSSAAALDGYGRALELQGLLDGVDSTRPWALAIYRRARAGAKDSGVHLLAGADQVRVFAKLGRYAEAQSLADSLLQSPAQTSESASILAGLAALTGRPLLAASLARRAAPDVNFLTTEGRPVQLPLTIGETAIAYLALASFQAPSDSMRAVDRRLLSQVDNLVARSDRSNVINAAFATPRALAYPVLGTAMMFQGSIGGNMLLALQQDLMRGDTAAVRQRLTSRGTKSRPVVYSELSLDLVLRESQMLLQIGDTTMARAELEAMIASLPATGLGLLGDLPHISIPQAAALPLSLALLADLTAYKGDHAAAEQLASGARALLAGSEPALSPVVERLRSVSKTAPQ
jgi:hypothetical protein